VTPNSKGSTKDAVVEPQTITKNRYKLNNYDFLKASHYQIQILIPMAICLLGKCLLQKLPMLMIILTYNIVFWFNTSIERTYTAKSANTLVIFNTFKYTQ
jgi:hypothetical protein